MKNDLEKKLINKFKQVIANDEKFGIKESFNFGNDTNEKADIEYLTNSGKYLINKAKSHHSDDKYNTIHKIFGQLLKENGKENPNRQKHSNALSYGILIPKDRNGIEFYSKGFNYIPEELFVEFGEITNTRHVFVCSEDNNSWEHYTWNDFYKLYEQF